MNQFPRGGGIPLLMPQQTAAEQIQRIELSGFGLLLIFLVTWLWEPLASLRYRNRERRLNRTWIGDFMHSQLYPQSDTGGSQPSKEDRISKLWKTVGSRLLAVQKKLFIEDRIDDSTAECRPVVSDEEICRQLNRQL
jgi:hypothetical protein